MFRLKSRKGISEIISVTLLIVIVVILASLFFAWSRNSAKTKMDQVTAELKAASDLECSNAQFYVDSCTIYSTTKTVRLVLMNNSDIRLFNLQLIINGNVSGSFNKIVEAGETAYLSTDTNFTVNRGDQNSLVDIDIEDIDNITLTNGACPKEVIDVSGCNIVSTFWPPTANVPSGTYYVEQSVTLSAGNGATIYYTLDGSTPTTDSNVYSSALTIPEDANTTLKAIAAKEGYVTSDINTWVYNITHTLEPPTADPVAGTYYGTTDITLSTTEEGAEIYYIVGIGVLNILYTVPITLSPSGSVQLIRARALKAGYGTSSEFKGTYQINDRINDSNDNLIYMFNFSKEGAYDVNATIDNDANTITAELPAGNNVTALSPIITIHRDATVNPKPGKPIDFTKSVEYRVTAGNHAIRDYIVTVTLAAPPRNNTIVFDTSNNVLTITLDPDISLEHGTQFIVYDNRDEKFIITDIETTSRAMSNAGPSPYDLGDGALTTIGFDTALFLNNYSKNQLSRFDIVDASNKVLATIPVADITVNSKE